MDAHAIDRVCTRRWRRRALVANGDRKVLPNLIVHNRAGSSAEQNMLVLEAKHCPTVDHRAFDYRKLAAFRTQFHYRQAVFLEFPPGEQPPCWQWITDENADPTLRPAGVSTSPDVPRGNISVLKRQMLVWPTPRSQRGDLSS
ncbi:hypothetical protein Val02_56970 [Virgisporangium aliadipatigenens]|uniref:Uncharacterized protein n=1 Tax=Virgisporangium aliadipatigenens TaxID=741659 RepID=A0A8J3YP52_9ACTN|nr:hypothetical protein [Virgisporangium aliadipatigenens]GIJ48811.1 hypothetical protein Val02_56970 [Virgisporangium aliadipatigenens]